jgi:hypothetical protein
LLSAIDIRAPEPGALQVSLPISGEALAEED